MGLKTATKASYNWPIDYWHKSQIVWYSSISYPHPLLPVFASSFYAESIMVHRRVWLSSLVLLVQPLAEALATKCYAMVKSELISFHLGLPCGVVTPDSVSQHLFTPGIGDWRYWPRATRLVVILIVIPSVFKTVSARLLMMVMVAMAILIVRYCGPPLCEHISLLTINYRLHGRLYWSHI